MSPAIIPTTPPVVPSDDLPVPADRGATHNGQRSGVASNGGVPATEYQHTDAASDGAPLPGEVPDDLVVRIAGRDERASVAELAKRAGSAAPAGALMVAVVGDRLLAVASMSDGEALKEPTPSGAAAAAVLRYRLASLGRRRRLRRAS